MHSVRLEPTKFIFIGTRTTHQATGDAGYIYIYIYTWYAVCTCARSIGRTPSPVVTSLPVLEVAHRRYLLLQALSKRHHSVCPRKRSYCSPEKVGNVLSTKKTMFTAVHAMVLVRRRRRDHGVSRELTPVSAHTTTTTTTTTTSNR